MFPAALELDLNDVRTYELSNAVYNRHLALLRQRRKTGSQLLDNRILPATKLRRINRRLCEGDAIRSHGLGILNYLCRVQQCFRGNTTHVEAHAAERGPALDERYIEPQIGGTERSGIAAWAGAEHENLRRCIRRLFADRR